MLLAENFLALKLGEVWTEMAQDFETTKFMPIAIDEQLILALTQRFCKWALYIQEAQLDLLHKEKQKAGTLLTLKVPAFTNNCF